MEQTFATVAVAFAGVFLICFLEGAFGGGFSIIGIPLLSVVMAIAAHNAKAPSASPTRATSPQRSRLRLRALRAWPVNAIAAGNKPD